MNKDKKRILWATAIFLVLSLLPMLSPVAAAATTISIQDVTVLPGESATIPIMITDVTDVGVAAIELSFNPSVVHVTAVTNSQFDVCDPTINNVTGEFEIGGVQFWSPGLNGNVRLANVTLKAVGTAGQSSPLNLTINELKTVGPPPQTIPADVETGTFTIARAEAAPYLVTYTISNHTIIPPQTTEIDVKFSERVEAWIKIEDVGRNLIKELYYKSMPPGVIDPTPKTWDGTNTTGIQVPDGDYYVNVTGLNTTTGLSVMNNAEIITVTSAPLPDTTAPTTEVTRPPDTTPIPSGTELPWTNKDVVISFRRVDNPGGTGVDYTNYSKTSGAGPWTTVKATTAIGPDAGNVSAITDETFKVTVSDEGITTIWYYSVDKNETPNVEGTKDVTVRIDKINPVVTDPGANPGSIPADGTTTAQLNVTVTDNVGVAGVTVDLSALGGSATQVMTRIPGTDIYTATTTAAVGTAPDTYLLKVNATDAAGNYNDTVSIELEVTPAVAGATIIRIGDATVPPGGSATLPIMITNVTDVGVAAIEFSYNSSVVHVTAVTDSQFDVCDPTIDNVTGKFEIAGVQFWSPGLNGNVRLANVTLQAVVSAAGQSSPLNLTINELKTVGPPPQNIPADVDNGTFTIQPAAPTTTISIGDAIVPPGGSATLPIMIINVTDVGVAAVEFSYNSSVVHVTAVTDSQFDVCDPTIDNVTGKFEIAGVQFWSPGLNGNVRLANVTLQAVVSAAGQSSPLNLTVNELKTVGPPPQNIPANVDNGTFTIIEVVEDNEPPVVTDPGANPGSIPADGTTTAQLNVTVTDNVEVASVTVNLSALGGSATQVMTNIAGTEIYTTTTTAAVTTAPGTYLLNVNATDTSDNYNDTVNISLEVTAPPTHGVDLSVDTPAITVLPNVNATYTLTVNNIGTGTDTFDLIVENADNAAVAALSEYQVTLASGANTTVLLDVADESANLYRVNVTVVSEHDPDATDYINTTTTVTAERYPYFVQGYVYDSTGSPVPAGVRVNITDETKGVTLNTTTDGTGFYSREIYVAIPEAEDGDLFTCYATYMNEGGLCSFILNRTANISQRCNITLTPYYRVVTLVYNDQNIGYNYVAWTGADPISASELVSMIRVGVGTGVFPDDAFIAYYNTTTGEWLAFFGAGTGTNFVLQQYEVFLVRVAPPGGTFYMPV